MRKTVPDKNLAVNTQMKSQLKPAYYLLLMAYLILPTFLPGFNTLDTNGPKFLVIAILNLVALMVFLGDPGFRSRPELHSGFFKNFIGLTYSLFLIISLLSFFKAINLTEAMMNFTRIFTVFSAACMLFVIFRSDRGYLTHLAVALNILLLFDSTTVFYNISRYIGGEIASIADIKSLYSNKNVLASALFVKLPAAIFLTFFFKGWKRRLGYFTGFVAVCATLLLSTRAFYFGMALLMTSLISFGVVRFVLFRQRSALPVILRWAGLCFMAILMYTAVQQLFYPKNRDIKYNADITTRLSSISSTETSTNQRLASWKRSLILIRENPWLGVGTGNWKVEVLKYENPLSADFNYAVKNHNDFLEITTETGIFGGLAFLSLFVLILFGFARASIKPDTIEGSLKYLFLPAFGILAYAVDAFFNFPADRPEIQVLFALYIAMAAVFVPLGFIKQTESESGSPFTKQFRKFHGMKVMAFVSFCLLSISIWILIQYSISLHYQLLAREDNFSGNFTHPASFFLKGFPAIPNLTCLGEPIVVNKARYLIVENRYREAITMLKSDFSSPYDSRRDYYLSMAYDKMGMTDSAIYWAKEAYRKQPLHGNLVIALSSRLFLKGRKKEGLQILDDYLAKVKTNPEAWLREADQYLQTGDFGKSMLLLDSAVKYLPYDTTIARQRKIIHAMVEIHPYEALLERANVAFNSKKYPEAIVLLSEFITKKPEFAEAYSHRAECLFYTGEYKRSIFDLDKAFDLGLQNRSDLLNLRGISYSHLGKNEEACRDFKLAMEKGNAQAASNYRKYCEKK